jgi:hypothetical protein
MSREWKPGSLAMVTALNRRTPYLAWFNGKTWVELAIPTNHLMRPETCTAVVVIDPENREQVNRLADSFCLARWSHAADSVECDPLTRSSMQFALREYLDPTPPKPDEPMGLGAAVEDEDGEWWVRVSGKTGFWWRNHQGGSRRWVDFGASVKVLSEGVTL